MLVWRRLASAKWEDAWIERLSFLGLERLAIFSLPRAKTVRIEAYSVSAKEARWLVRHFGGQVRKVAPVATFERKPREPIRIRQALVIVRSEAERRSAVPQFPGRQVITIPAAM